MQRTSFQIDGSFARGYTGKIPLETFCVNGFRPTMGDCVQLLFQSVNPLSGRWKEWSSVYTIIETEHVDIGSWPTGDVFLDRPLEERIKVDRRGRIVWCRVGRTEDLPFSFTDERKKISARPLGSYDIPVGVSILDERLAKVMFS